MTKVLTLRANGSDDVIAQLDVDDKGMLNAGNEVPAEVSEMIAEINAMESLRVDAIPPSGAAQFEVFAMDVDRSDPEIAEIVVQLIAERYAFNATIK